MVYESPNMELSAAAVRLVKGGASDKSTGSCRDAADKGTYTTGAYEIDE